MALKLYDSWVENIYAGTDEDREKIVNDAINRIAVKSGKAQDLIRSFQNDDEFKKLSTMAFIFYIPINSKKDGYVKHKKFAAPLTMKTHKRLPMTLGIGGKISSPESWVSLDEVKKAMGVKQALGFVDRLSRMDTKSKKELLEKTYEGLEFYRDEKEGKDSIRKMKSGNGETGWLSDFLRSGSEYELNGFAVNYPYINLDSKYGDTEPFWVHPWGPGQLVFSHRTIPSIIIVGPSQREDENVLGQRNMIGKTG